MHLPLPVLLFVVVFIVCLIPETDAFWAKTMKSLPKGQPNYAVTEVTSVESFDSIVKENSDKLVVIDYSTTWCGPCKLAFPKFVEMSERHTDVVFLKCVGDSTADTSALMKREGIRSVPAFHFWRKGRRLESINGAKMDDIEATIRSLKMQA